MTTVAWRNNLNTRARGLWAAARLGWAIESNWTDPFVFMTYQIVRPLFGALILVVMYRVIKGPDLDPMMFAQIFVANAFFIIVMQSMIVIGMVIFEDRERYEMIRYVYLAPIGLGPYILARGASHIAATSASVILTLLLGVLAFGVPLTLGWSQVPYLVGTLGLGIIATLSMGLILAGVTMLLMYHGQSMPEGVVGILYLMSGVVFTTDILPGPFAQAAQWLPWTYWLEGLRLTLLGSTFNPSLSGLGAMTILLRLTLLSCLTAVTAAIVLRLAQHTAVARGKLDEKTDH